MIRKLIIKRNINTSNIHHIVGHNGSVFFKIFFKYLCYLLALLLLFLLLQKFVVKEWPYLNRVFAGIGFILFIKFAIDFFNIYLDCLVMTETGIILYLREGLLEYKTENISRDSIETISFNQKGIRDKLFMKGDVTIALEHGIEFPFEDVPNPKKQVETILQLKNRFMTPLEQIQEDIEKEDKKFDVLVEALGEVVKDYIDKDKNTGTDESYFL